MMFNNSQILKICIIFLGVVVLSVILYKIITKIFSPPSGVNLDLMFPPYDCPTNNQTMIDLGMIKAITDAAKKYKGKLDPNDPTNNPFQIKYSVYNLYDDSYINGLINAYKAGVYVQVLIQITQLQAGYNPTYAMFKKAGLHVQDDLYKDNQETITDKTQFDSLNLIGIKPRGSLMHCKTRYYKIGTSGEDIQIGDKSRKVTEAIVTGSFNPECAATDNNEFLVVLTTDNAKTPQTIQNYMSIYEYVKRDKK